jgi:phospholipid-translocating ATPase
MMEQMYVMIYNFMFSALPPLCIGAFEKKLPEDVLADNPRLYRYVRN